MQVVIYMRREDLEKVDAFRRGRAISRSRLIQDALKEFMQRHPTPTLN